MTNPYVQPDVDPSTHTGGGILHVNGEDTATHPFTHLWLPDLNHQHSVASWAASHGFKYYAFTPYSSPEAWACQYPGLAFTLVTTLPGISQDDSPLPSLGAATAPAAPPPPSGAGAALPPSQGAALTSPPGAAPPPPWGAGVALPPSQGAALTSPPGTAPPPPSGAGAGLPPSPGAALPSLPGTAAASSQPPDTNAQLLLLLTTQLQQMQHQMLQQQQQQQQQHDLFTQLLKTGSFTGQKKPVQDLPVFDGNEANIPFFLHQIELFKADPFFAKVDDWTLTKPAYNAESQYLCGVLLKSIPPSHRPKFLSDPKYQYDGIALLRDFIELINPSNPQNLLKTAIEWANLEMDPQENGAQFMARVRALFNRLCNCSLDQFIYLLTIARLDPTRYPGIHNRYRQGEASLLHGDVHSLTEEVQKEDAYAEVLDVPLGPASANRAGGKAHGGGGGTRPQAGSAQGGDGDNKTKPPPSPPGKPNYPYPQVKWYSLQKLLDEGKTCALCYQPCHDSFGGCPAAAARGYVLIKDESAAQGIMAKYNEHRAKSPPKTPQKQNDGKVSGKRATSTERPPPTSPPPLGKTSPDGGKSTRPSVQLVDKHELSSDSEDDSSFQQEATWLQVASRKSSIKPKNASSAYSQSCCRAHATGRKTNDSYASTVVSAFKSYVQSNPGMIQLVRDDGDEACADSGATHYMFPDYAAFLSYRRCSDRTCDLGDDTSVPILGVGTAAVRLNGKAILLRNALHVPALRNPLYSLRRHSKMPGCGVFSWHDTGSFLVFPDFILSVDDSVDNMVSYEPLGRSYSGRYDYAEPRVYPTSPASGRPVTVSDRPPSTPAPASPDHPTVTQDEQDGSGISVEVDVRDDADSVHNTNDPATSVDTTDEDSDEGSDDNPVQVVPDPIPLTPDATATSVDDTDVNTDEGPDDNPVEAVPDPISLTTLRTLHEDPTDLPSVRPCHVPAACENRTAFDTLKLHRIFACRSFRNQRLVTAASSNATLVSTGARPPTLGDFVTIPNPPRGKPNRKRRKYLDKCHMDIVYGDSVALHGYRYALLIVDAATRYIWIYGLTSLTGGSIVDALAMFRSEAGRLPRRFHSDFDKKLIGGKALRYILQNNSRIIAANAGRQSSNGLVERQWRTIVEMARAYMTEKQVSRDYWFFALSHAVLMLNQIPGRLNDKLTTPYELVHGEKPDSRTWFELFSVGFFRHDTDVPSGDARSKSQAQTLDGIAVGHDSATNTITFYNPLTRQYYRPQAFKLDESRLPITMYPKSIHYDGGLTCGLLRHNTDPVPEPFPPGTRVTIQQESQPVRGTIANVPITTSPIVQPSTADSEISSVYVIHLDNGTTIEMSYEDLVALDAPSAPQLSPNAPTFDGLPAFLQQDSKITLDHNGAFHRGYLHYSDQGGFAFVFRKTARSTRIEWSVPLPDLRQNWPTLVGEDTLIPGHGQISSFLKPNSSNNAPSAKFVSAKNLLSPCPPSLQQALHPTNPDRHIWLDSYREEAQGLLDLDVYERISKKEYLALRRSGVIPKAIPSMCVLVVKPDKNGNPHRAKSRIVVLGNHEDRIYSKSQRYAPVLKYSSLRLLTSKAVGDKRVLQQGDCKNAFCQAVLPDNEATVVRPPVGDPDYNKEIYWKLKKSLYGLRRSPRHWFNRIASILQGIGLVQSPHDPCIFSGIIDPSASAFPTTTNADGTITVTIPAAKGNPESTITLPSTRQMIHVGIYVDDFVFYSTSDEEEELFRKSLQSKVAVDFMGDVDYFLGSAFLWKRHEDGHVSVHMSQSAFTEHTAHRYGLDKFKRVPNMTPYRSGLPIDSLPPADDQDTDLKRRTKLYQGIVGSINWLAQCTRPDVAPALTFLASYSHAPSTQHYQAALHVLKYLYSTSEYGISYHSDACNTLQAFNHFPHHHDKEAYTDATPPSVSEVMRLTSFADSCWGAQIGNALPEGTPIELFKFRSLSGYVICRTGGPIAWRSIRQARTALSSCEAEIFATNECVKETLAIKLLADDLHMPDGSECVPVYNDNDACVSWSHSVTNKGTKHMNLRENSVREAHRFGEVNVQHIPGVINPSDIYTKEIKDDAHFRRLRDCQMVSRSNFFKYGHTIPAHLISKSDLPYYSLSASVPASAWSQ